MARSDAVCPCSASSFHSSHRLCCSRYVQPKTHHLRCPPTSARTRNAMTPPLLSRSRTSWTVIALDDARQNAGGRPLHRERRCADGLVGSEVDEGDDGFVRRGCVV